MVIAGFPIDGNWVDIGSLASGLIYAVVTKVRRRSKFISKETGMGFANGAAIFPLVILMLCVLSSELVKGLLEASKMSLSVAGFFALLAILEDDGPNDGEWY